METEMDRIETMRWGDDETVRFTMQSGRSLTVTLDEFYPMTTGGDALRLAVLTRIEDEEMDITQEEIDRDLDAIADNERRLARLPDVTPQRNDDEEPF